VQKQRKSKSKNKKIVIDVNVWLSMFMTNTQSDFVRGDIGMVFVRSNEMTEELLNKMSVTKIDSRLVYNPKLYINFYNSNTVFVKTKKEFFDCRDPDDNYLFDLAIQTKADYLVSGDDGVLDTPIPPPTKVISYTQFKEMFEIQKPLLNDKPKSQGFLDWLKKDLAKFFKK